MSRPGFPGPTSSALFAADRRLAWVVDLGFSPTAITGQQKDELFHTSDHSYCAGGGRSLLSMALWFLP